MRKLKIFCSLLLCALVTAVQAQTLVENAATELTDGTYISLQCRDTNGGAGYYFNGPTTKSISLLKSNIYKVVDSSTDGFKLCRVTDNKYLTRNGDAISLTENADEGILMTAVSYGEGAFTIDAGTEMEGTEKAKYVRFTNNGNILNTQAKDVTPKFTANTLTGGYSAWYVYKYTQNEVDAINRIISTLEGIQSNKAYYLKSARGDDKYLVYASRDYISSNHGTGVTGWTLDGANCWKFAIYKKSDSDNHYYIYNLQSGSFIGYASANNSDIPLVPYPTNHIEISTTSNVAQHPFMLFCQGENVINVANEGTKGVVIWTSGKEDYDDTGNAFQIIEAGDLAADVQTKIINRVEAAKAGIALSTDQTYSAKIGSAYITNMPFDENINCLKGYTDVESSKSGKAILKLEQDEDGLPYVYRIKYRQNQTSEEYTNLVWLNTGEAKQGVQVLTDENLNLSSHDKWYIYPAGTANTYKVRPYPSGLHWNVYGGGSVNPIGTWGDENLASNVVFEEISLTEEAIASAFEDYKNKYLESVPKECPWTNTRDNIIGYASTEYYPNAIENARSTSSLYECMKALQEKYNILLPDPDKYYMISDAKAAEADKKYLCEKYSDLQDGSYKFFCETLDKNTVPSLWQFERMTDRGKTQMLRIKSPNSGLYVSKATWGYTMRMLPDGNADVGEFDLAPKTYVNVDDAVDLHDTTHDGTPRIESSGNLTSWNIKDTEEHNNFFIEEVNEIPVSIGTALYATLNLPFAVEINENVTAYTAADKGDALELTEISGGVIPARTPIILIADAAGIYNFTIAYGNTEDPLLTDLNGTLEPETIDTGATAYILKNSETKGVGMYLVNSETDRTIPANKAYLGSTTAPATGEVKRFVTGNPSTGIDSIADPTTENAGIYTLDGRRVAQPSKGVYIMGGKKVIFK